MLAEGLPEQRKKPVQVLDMSKATSGELEDLAYYKKNLFFIQGQDGLFLMKY